MKWRLSLIGLAAVVAMAGCGGGGDGPVNVIKVAGDSLSDSGTLGFKFTVQNAPGTPFKIWTDVVADSLGVAPLCARYQGSDPTAVALNASATTCTSYAIGGGRVSLAGAPTYSAPLSVIQQLQDIAAAGEYDRDELLLVNGGGNDVADLTGAFLAAAQDEGASYAALLATELTSAEISAASAGGQPGLAQAGGLYIQRVSNRLTTAVTTQALNKGAKRVILMTVPDVTKTPRFLTLLAGIAATQGQATAEDVRQTANAWAQAFNQQLRSNLGNDRRVIIADFYTELNRWTTTPASFGLTNATTPACPSTGTDAQGLPEYTIYTCAASALSAAPPTGITDPDWWKSYVFSDNFHGTPRTNELMGNYVLTLMEQQGWK